METTLKRIFHRRGPSSLQLDGDPTDARSQSQSPRSSVSSIPTSPYHHVRPGAPPTQGKGPLHGHSRSPSGASQATKQNRLSRDAAARRSLSLRKSAPPAEQSEQPQQPDAAELSQALARHYRPQTPPQPPADGSTAMEKQTAASPASPLPGSMAQENQTRANAAAASPPPGTAITSDNATYLDSPIDTNGSLGLEHMTLGGDKSLMTRPSRRRYSEDIAARNLHNPYEDAGHLPVVADETCAEDVAARNVLDESQRSSIHFVPDSAEHASHLVDENDYSGEVGSIGRRDGHAPRRVPETNAGSNAKLKKMYGIQRDVHTPRPIPGSFPSDNSMSNFAVSSVSPKEGDSAAPTADGPVDGAEKSWLVEGAAEKPSLNGVVDLRNTEDTTYHEHYAPAVTHETVLPSVHHIREERIHRDIHTHDIHHRILPVVDVEVLPARHYIPVPASPSNPNAPAELREIPASSVPGRSGNYQNWVVAETVSRLPSSSTSSSSTGPTAFSARQFEGKQGDEKAWVDEHGTQRKESTWVHPPTLETGARDAGQTVPFYFSGRNRRRGAADEVADGAAVVGSKGAVDGAVPEGADGAALDTGAEPMTEPQRLKALAKGVTSAPFDECKRFEAGGKAGAEDESASREGEGAGAGAGL